MKTTLNVVDEAVGLRNWVQLDVAARAKLTDQLNIKHFPYTKWAMIPLKDRMVIANYFIALNKKNSCNLRP